MDKISTRRANCRRIKTFIKPPYFQGFYEFYCNIVYKSHIFHYKGIAYKGQAPVSAKWAHSAKTREAIRIGFIPNNPELNLPVDINNDLPLWAAIPIVLILLSLTIYLGTSLILIFIRASRSEKPFVIPKFN
jgi:hypothetical protein